MNNEGIKIDGIPIEDYNGFTSRTSYGIRLNETPIVKPGIYFDGVKITTAEEWNKAIEEFRKRANDFIPKQKIRAKIRELENMRNTTITSEGFNILNGEIVVLKELLGEGEK